MPCAAPGAVPGAAPLLMHALPILRREDARLLTGAGRYAADWPLPGLLHAAFVRADRAHARIARIDVDAARAAPGVHAVLTHADVAHQTWPPSFVSFPGKGGQAIRQPQRSILAHERVRFVGEAIAMVVADTLAQALDACERVVIDYDDLPVVADPDDAVRPGAPQLYEAIPGNVAFEYETGDAAKVNAAFAQAAHVVEVAIDSPRVVANPMEPRACTAAYDAAHDTFTVYLPTQGLPMMRAHLARMTGLAPERLTLVAQDVGGGFGSRSTAEPEYGPLLVAAQRLGRPVRWVGTRSETFLTDAQGRANRMRAQLALDARGGFLAFRFEFLSDLGAYLTPIGAMVHAMNPTFCGGGVYHVPALHGSFRQVLTNTAPVGAYRGAGRPDIAYLVERTVDEAARVTGMDRVALRRLNYVDVFPYTTANGFTYDSGDFAGCLDDALAAADWHSFESRRAAARAERRLRGIGLASFIESSGGGVAAQDEVSIRFKPDGAVELHAATQSNGQGHETTFPLLVARETGLAPERMRLVASDAASGLSGSGSFASRSLLVVGSAFKVASTQLVERARPHAATALGVTPEEVAWVDGAFVAGAQRMTLAALVERLAGPSPHPLDVTAGVPPSRVFPNGCHVAEVEIDIDSGESRIVRYTAADDFGNVVNHTVVEGQLHGGLAQGAGQVFGEHAHYDRDTGQLLTGTFMDYPMPRADLFGDIRIIDHPVPSPSNALGAKGAGEAGTTGSIPALMSALLDALRPLGVTHLDMPATPERLWRAIHEAPRRTA
jgi:carbon-monoxide dehydrogenase large subunit